VKVNKLIINLPPNCAFCKDKKDCKLIKYTNSLLKSFKRKKITKNAVIKYNKNKILLHGYVGTDESNHIPYWVELKVTAKELKGKDKDATMIYVPPEEGYACSELKEEHKISYM